MIEFLLLAILLVLLVVFLPGVLAGIIAIAICSFIALVLLLLFGHQSWFWPAMGAGIFGLLAWKIVLAVINAIRMKGFVSWCEGLPDRLASKGIKAWLYRSGDKPRFIFVDNTGDAVAKQDHHAFFYCRDGEVHEELIAIDDELCTWQKNLKLATQAYNHWIFGSFDTIYLAKSVMPTREYEGGRRALIHKKYVFRGLIK